MRLRSALVVAALAACVTTARPASAQDASLGAVVHIGTSYRTTADVTYLTLNGVGLKLDVHQNRTATAPAPTFVWIHGGNWVGGSKDASLLSLLPFFQMGWNVVNVDYRLMPGAPAPAAVEDCHCALRWVAAHAAEYNIDTERVVVGGNSAGGQLSLMGAMAPMSAGFDQRCPGPTEIKVAAVVNWYGFPSLLDVLDGPTANAAVNAWIGAGADRKDLALKLSPRHYVRAGVPPVFTVHGNADPTSPYEHAQTFHAALTKAGVTNQLLTIPNGKHGGFTDAETLMIYEQLTAFLTRVLPAR